MAPLPPTQTDKGQFEAWRREQARRANDQFKVFNPLKKDWSEFWDGFPHRVPAGGSAVVTRYIMEKYFRNMVMHLVNSKNEEMVEEENKRRVSSGQKAMDHQERELFDTKPVINSETKMLSDKRLQEINEKYLDPKSSTRLVQGLVREWGLDEMPEQEAPADRRTDFDQMLDQYEDLRVEEDTPVEVPDSAPTNEVLQTKSQPQLRAIANKMEIPSVPTDKKAELIAKISQHGVNA
jgi:hypothetical protein